MKFNQLNNKAKQYATDWFNKNDGYSDEYKPATVEDMESISDTNRWEFDEDGRRKNGE